MSIDVNNVITLLLGGGLATIVTLLAKGIKEWREGRTAREDTAISRWRDLAKEYRLESESKSEVIRAYRKWYPRLWAAYMGKGGVKAYFPTDPTQVDDDLYGTDPTAQSAPSAARKE